MNFTISKFEKRIPFKKQRRIDFSRKYLFKLLKDKGNLICHYCNRQYLKIEMDSVLHPISEYEKASIDHIIPVSKGGDIFNSENMIVSCALCNSIRGNMDYGDYINKIYNIND